MDVKVQALWDDAESVWSASSDDVFGLFIEADSLDDLVTRLFLTFTDLWTYSDKTVTPEIMFEVECIMKQASLPSHKLKLHRVP